MVKNRPLEAWLCTFKMIANLQHNFTTSPCRHTNKNIGNKILLTSCSFINLWNCLKTLLWGCSWFNDVNFKISALKKLDNFVFSFHRLQSLTVIAFLRLITNCPKYSATTFQEMVSTVLLIFYITWKYKNTKSSIFLVTFHSLFWILNSSLTEII